MSQKVRLKLGEEHAKLIAQHRGVALVAKALFPGDSKTSKVKPGEAGVQDLAAGHADLDAAVAAINKAMMI